MVNMTLGYFFKGSSWVGWMNNGSGRVQLLFEFHSAREFNSLTLQLAKRASNDNSSSLTSAVINFALENGNYLGKSVRSGQISDGHHLPGLYNVTIDLKKRVGRFVQLQLDYTSQWLLLSEVTFQSGKFIFVFCFALETIGFIWMKSRV